MNTAALLTDLAALYPPLADQPPPGWAQDVATLPGPLDVPAGTVLFDEGAPCRGFPLVLAGEVQVARGAPQGRAIELYRVHPGEICVVSASCLFGHTTLAAHGVAVQATRLLLLPPAVFMRWSDHQPFRQYVFSLFAARMADLIALAEAVAFQRLDQRLAAALLGRGAVLQVTHQHLADELGTVREMVTRLLKRFEQSGWVQLGRERIQVLNAPALRQLAAGQGPGSVSGM